MITINTCKYSTFFFLFILFSGSSYSEIIHSERSLYRNLIVEDQGDLRCLKFKTKQQSSQQSCIFKSNPNHLVFNYTKWLMASLFLNDHPKKILIIGLGGGTLSNNFHLLFPNSEITNVELDPAVIKLARQYFAYIENEKIKTVAQDGRIFMKRAIIKNRHYDMIILDAFNGDYIPEHLMTQEFLQEAKQLLTENGVLAANTFSVSKLYQHESATYQAVFGDFYNVRDGQKTNRIILASKSFHSQASIMQREQKLRSKLLTFGIYSPHLKSLMKIAHDWPANTRLLTDQYAPVNLLNMK